MRRKSLLTVTISLAVLLAAPPAAAASAPAVVRCGATLTEDAYLAADLTCTKGVIIGRTLSLDLRGHRLSGGPGAGAAITVTGGAPKIFNGRIDHWGIGIDGEPDLDSAATTSPVMVSNIILSENRIGLNSPGNFIGVSATDFTVDATTFTRNSSGIEAGSFGGVFVVTNSTFSDNTSAASAVEYSYIRLSRSRLVGNKTALSCDEAVCSADGSVFEGNGEAVFANVTGIDLTRNAFDRNDTAVFVSAVLGSTISTNLFTRNKRAVQLENSQGSVTRNVFLGNGVGIGTADSADGLDLTLSHNQLVGNGSAIYLQSTGTKLRSNTAVRNKQWGIYAPGAVDLGDNKAAGNGKSPQCVGVRCS